MSAVIDFPLDEQTRTEIRRVFELQQQTKLAWRRDTVDQRLARLQRLREVFSDHRQQMLDAARADMNKPMAEAVLGELFPVLNTIDFARKNLKGWMKPRRVRTPMSMLGTRSELVHEPKGVSLIIAPWNYPFFLSFVPLANALAAGCPAIIKPSEMTPAMTGVIRDIVAAAFAPEEVAVFDGGPTIAQALLELPFDHIFYTGNPEIGKVVMRAAAEHLTSVTLELGGKSPVVIDETADVDTAAERIAWGKFLNCGQTCVAPDYVFVHESRRDELLDAFGRVLGKRYADLGASGEHYGRIVNERHHQRVTGLLDDALQRGARVAVGGSTDATQNYVSPTVLADVDPASKLMQEEIFGPLLPVMSYRELDEVLEFINSKPKPLALYAFSKVRDTLDRVLRSTSAGGTTLNHVMLHGMNPYLPFGGVNNSGIGKTNGYYGFQAFSNERAVTRQTSGFSATRLMAAPYSDRVRSMLNRFVR